MATGARADTATFSDVVASAIASAVRRAVADVGPAPYLELEPAVIDLTDPPGPDVVDPYEIVGTEPSATWEEIVASYRARARAWHPDRRNGHGDGGVLLRRLNGAYEELRIRRGRRPLDGVVQTPTVPLRRSRDDDRDEVDVRHTESPEHSWWADAPIDPFGRPTGDRAPEPEPVETPAAEQPAEVVGEDPYDVLRLPPSASWEEIVAAYRKLARWYHPDGLIDPRPSDREACEAMIRRLNAAYAELRVRRGR